MLFFRDLWTLLRTRTNWRAVVPGPLYTYSAIIDSTEANITAFTVRFALLWTFLQTLTLHGKNYQIILLDTRATFANLSQFGFLRILGVDTTFSHSYHNKTWFKPSVAIIVYTNTQYYKNLTCNIMLHTLFKKFTVVQSFFSRLKRIFPQHRDRVINWLIPEWNDVRRPCYLCDSSKNECSLWICITSTYV